MSEDQDRKKLNRIKKQMEALMMEATEDMLDDEVMDHLREHVNRDLKELGIALRGLDALKAYKAGFEFGMSAHGNDMGTPMLVGLAKLITLKQKEMDARIKGSGTKES